jgi:AcrR family transcriptional regulator
MREKKVNKRKVQGAETKQRLYEIAKRLFSERDYTEVSLEDITDEAGITKGAFYVHFESKDALIAAIIADITNSIDTDYQAFLETLPADMSASDMLLALTEKISDVLVDNIGYENMKKVYQLLLLKTVDTEAVKGYGRELFRLYQIILEKGIERGEFKNVQSVEDLSRQFVVALRGFSYEWCIRYPEFRLKEQVIEHFRILIQGIKMS